MNELDWEKLWREAEGKEGPEAEQPEPEECEAEQPEELEQVAAEENPAPDVRPRKRRVIWGVAAILCVALIAFCAANPKRSEAELSPFGRLYMSYERIYDTDWLYEQGVNLIPLYVTEEGKLLANVVSSYLDVEKQEWLAAAVPTETRLTRKNFDDLFRGRSDDWDTDDTAEGLRRENLRVWAYADDFASTSETDFPNLYLLLQRDGSVLLVYWEGHGEDAEILSVLELQEAVAVNEEDKQ